MHVARPAAFDAAACTACTMTSKAVLLTVLRHFEARWKHRRRTKKRTFFFCKDACLSWIRRPLRWHPGPPLIPSTRYLCLVLSSHFTVVYSTRAGKTEKENYEGERMLRCYKQGGSPRELIAAQPEQGFSLHSLAFLPFKNFNVCPGSRATS